MKIVIHFILFITLSLLVMNCSSTTNETNQEQVSSPPLAKEEKKSSTDELVDQLYESEKYVNLANEFCDCNGNMLIFQKKISEAKMNQDLAALKKVREEMLASKDNQECMEDFKAKINTAKTEDGDDVATKSFEKSAYLYCPQFKEYYDFLKSNGTVPNLSI